MPRILSAFRRSDANDAGSSSSSSEERLPSEEELARPTRSLSGRASDPTRMPNLVSLSGSWINVERSGNRSRSVGLLHFPESAEALVHGFIVLSQRLPVFPLVPLVAIYDSEEATFPKPEPIAPSSMLLISVSKNILKFLVE